jgi:hypothetical protein
MPTNSLNVISVITDVVGLVEYAFSAADDWAALSEIGPGGTSLSLPADPSGGDNFGFFDSDGSCTPGSPIRLSAADGKPVNGQSTGPSFTIPFSAARAVFDERLGGWTIVSAAPADGLLRLARGWGDNPDPIALATTNPTIVASATVTPSLTGKLRAIVTGTLSNNAGTPTNLVLSVSLGTPADVVYTQGPAHAPPNSSVWTSLVVDLDKLPTPVLLRLGLGLQLNAVLTAAAAGVVEVPAHGMQIEVQEVS